MTKTFLELLETILSIKMKKFSETTSIFEITKSKNSVTTTLMLTNIEENSENVTKSKVENADLDRFLFLSFFSYFLLNTLC